MNSNIILVCPKNDEESLTIIRLAEAFNIKTIVSSQPHGARLENEPDIISRIKSADSETKEVAIVEMPGPSIEEEIKTAGYTLHIIDHHEYEDISRMKPESSLEQFLNVFQIREEEIKTAGFDPDIIKGIAAMDRGFLGELKQEGFSTQKEKEIILHYRSLRREVRGEICDQEETEAQRVWQSKKDANGILILRSDQPDISIRDALSYLIHEAHEKIPVSIITQGNQKAYVQNTNQASKLHEQFGGFTFGGGRCWGILSKQGKAPTVDEILKVIVE